MKRFLTIGVVAALVLPIGGALAADPSPEAVTLQPTFQLGGDKVSPNDAGFVPDTGQINLGYDPKLPSDSQPRPVPTPAQALAAAMTPVSTQPALGDFGNVQPGPTPGVVGDIPKPEQKSADGTASPAPAAHTTGSTGASEAEVDASAPSGPIGAIGVTMPAKFSQRNDVLDRVPIMAAPLPLSEQQRKSIYQAVMADKTPTAAGADTLAPASVLSSKQYFNDLHPLPASVSNIAAVSSLGYVKAKSKVLLVEPSTRVVFGEIEFVRTNAIAGWAMAPGAAAVRKSYAGNWSGRCATA